MRNYTDEDILNGIIGTDIWVKVRNNESVFFDEYYIKILGTFTMGYQCTIVDAYLVENFDDLAFIDAFIENSNCDCNPRNILLFNEDIYIDDIELVKPVEYMSENEILEAVDKYSAVDLSEYLYGR